MYIYVCICIHACVYIYIYMSFFCPRFLFGWSSMFVSRVRAGLGLCPREAAALVKLDPPVGQDAARNLPGVVHRIPAQTLIRCFIDVITGGNNQVFYIFYYWR